MPNNPIRVFEGEQRPHEPFWRFVDAAEAESGEPELEFYGYISEYSWFGDEITPALFKDQLYKFGNSGPVTVRMNSGGGDVIAASVIRSIIMDYPGRVTVRIDGLCASAATFVAIAGDVVKMQDTGFFMIHDPLALVWGNIEELKKALDLLKTVKDGIIDAYQVRTDLGTEKLGKMMTDETWMTAVEAKAFGFVDEVVSNSQKKAVYRPGAQAVLNALTNYRNVPDALSELLQSDPVKNQQAVAKLRAEVQILCKP
jgi:ATP-dependent Clp protease, protease subunit